MLPGRWTRAGGLTFTARLAAYSAAAVTESDAPRRGAWSGPGRLRTDAAARARGAAAGWLT